MNMTRPHGRAPTITSTERIKSKALEILKTNPEGLRYSELIRFIHKELPEIPINTIHGIIWNLETRVPEQVYKPGRGSYRCVEFRDTFDWKGQLFRRLRLDTGKSRMSKFLPLPKLWVFLLIGFLVRTSNNQTY